RHHSPHALLLTLVFLVRSSSRSSRTADVTRRVPTGVSSGVSGESSWRSSDSRTASGVSVGGDMGVDLYFLYQFPSPLLSARTARGRQGSGRWACASAQRTCCT